MPAEPTVPAAPPLTMEDVHKLIGALYLEIDRLRRHVEVLQAHITANGDTPPRPE